MAGKKESGRLAIRPDHPRRHNDVKVCMPGGIRCVVLYISFIKIGSVILPLWMVENRLFYYFGLYNSVYYRTCYLTSCLKNNIKIF